jgi:hypothetical protein
MATNTATRDSRSTARGPLRRAGATRTESSSSTRGTVNEPVAFRRLMRALLDARPTERAKPYERVVAFLRAAREPGACINILLEECATNSGQDGLGLGIDVLERTGTSVLDVAEAFTTSDAHFRNRHESRSPSVRAQVVLDGVWYMLLRGVARTEAPEKRRAAFLVRALLRHPWASVRVSAVEALGELASRQPDMKERVRAFLELLPELQSKLAPTLKAVLADLEG